MVAITPEAAFEARGLDAETAAKYGVTFNNGAFRFEYLNQGKLCFTKVRTLKKRFHIEPSGQRLQLWNLEMLKDLPSRPTEPLVITEGEFDALAVLQSVGGYAVSVPNGAPSRPTEGAKLVADDKAFSYLWGDDEKLIPEIDQFDKIIIATDNDGPGLVLRNELAMRIGDARCWFVTYPRNCKDANDALRNYGAKGVAATIDRAKPMRPGHLVRPSDVPPKLFDTVYSTGWDFMDDRIKLVRPELVVVTGIPGHGKGQWVRAMCCHLAETHGFRTAFFAPEDPAHRIKRDLRKFFLRRSANPIFPSKEDEDAAVAWMDQHFMISMPPEDETATIAFIENEMASAALHHNCQAFVIDPWNEIFHMMNGLSETQYIEQTLVKLKQIARRYGLVLIIVAHPRKLAPGETPDLYSINGSANWKNKCDHGIIVVRMCRNFGSDASPDIRLTNETKIILEKCKDQETMGTPGTVKVFFNRERCDYEFIPSGDDLKKAA